MRPLPRLRVPDSSLGLLTDGYGFISNRCDRLGTDAFETRLLLRRTVCLRGEAAARLVYDRDRFERAGAAPRRMRKTLLGEGGGGQFDHGHGLLLLCLRATIPGSLGTAPSDRR